MTILTSLSYRPEQQVSAMQSYVQPRNNHNARLGVLERILRNASIAGLAGVALSGAVTLMPAIPSTAGTQWVCACLGALVGVALAFRPDRTGAAAR